MKYTIEYLFRLRDQYTRRAREMARASDQARRQIHATGGALNKMERDANRASTAVSRLAVQLRALRTVGRTMGGMGITGGLLGGFGAYGGARAVKRYADYESSLTDLRKVWTKSQEGYDRLVRLIKAEHGRIPLTRADIVKLTEEGVRAYGKKLTPEQFIDYTKQVARFSVAYGLPIARSAEVLGKLRSQLEMTSVEFEKFGDLMNTVANTFSLSEKEILETARRQAGLVKSITDKAGPKGDVKQGIKDFVSISAAQLAVGTPKEVAATGLRTLLARLSIQPKDTKKALKRLGFNAKRIKRQLPEDLFGTIREVLGRIAQLPAHERAGVLGQLAGMKTFDAFSRLLGNIGMLDEVRGVVMSRERLTMLMEYNRRIKTLNSLLQITANVVADLSDSLVKYWDPSIRSALKWVRQLSKNLEGNPWLAWAAGLYVAASALAIVLFPLGMLAWSLSMLGPVIIALLLPFKKLGGAIRIVAGLLAAFGAGLLAPLTRAAAMLGPKGKLLLGLALLRAAARTAIVFTILWEGSKLLLNWEKFIASIKEPHRVSIIWPEAPGWFKWLMRRHKDAMDMNERIEESLGLRKPKGGVGGAVKTAKRAAAYAPPYIPGPPLPTRPPLPPLPTRPTDGVLSMEGLAALRAPVEVNVKAPSSITLKLPNGTVAGTIPLTTEVRPRGEATTDSNFGPMP